MSERRIPFYRYLTAGLAVMLPAAAAMMLLVWWDEVGIGALAAAIGLALLASAAVAHFYLRDVARFAAFLDELASDREPVQPRFAIAPAAELFSSAAVALTSGWRRHRSAIEGLAASAQAIVDGLPDPLVALDRQRRIVRANKAAEALLGEVPLGRDLSAWLRQPGLLDAADQTLAAGQRIEDRAVELSLSGPPAREMIAHVRRLPAATADGSLALVVLHDVTAQRRAEAMRADFVANASHELKTPLASLLGFIETLRGPARDDPPAQERFLGIMAEQAERMRRLVGDLLVLSQIEQREHHQPHGAVELGVVLRGVRDALLPRALAREVTIAIDNPGDVPAVEGDGEEITIMFQNLLDNAVKYTRPGSTVDVRVSPAEDDRLLRVDVADRGEGIASHHLPRLTERFYRVDSARSRELGGTGLGLAIVKHLVNRHRGRLAIASEPGVGSVFSVFLPAHAGGSAAADAASPAPANRRQAPTQP